MIDLEEVRQAEIDFGLRNTDGHEVLMLIGPMADEIRHLRGRLRRIKRIAEGDYFGASDRKRALIAIVTYSEVEK
jgi:hypothetical protein